MTVDGFAAFSGNNQAALCWASWRASVQPHSWQSYLPQRRGGRRCVCACWLLLKEIYSSLGSLVLERLGVLPPAFIVPQHEAFTFHLKDSDEGLLLVIFHCGSERSAKICLIIFSASLEEWRTFLPEM